SDSDQSKLSGTAILLDDFMSQPDQGSLDFRGGHQLRFFMQAGLAGSDSGNHERCIIRGRGRAGQQGMPATKTSNTRKLRPGKQSARHHGTFLRRNNAAPMAPPKPEKSTKATNVRISPKIIASTRPCGVLRNSTACAACGSELRDAACWMASSIFLRSS